MRERAAQEASKAQLAAYFSRFAHVVLFRGSIFQANNYDSHHSLSSITVNLRLLSLCTATNSSFAKVHFFVSFSCCKKTEIKMEKGEVKITAYDNEKWIAVYFCERADKGSRREKRKKKTDKRFWRCCEGHPKT